MTKNGWKLRIVALSLIIMILLSSSSNLVSMASTNPSTELVKNALSKSAWQFPSVDKIIMQTLPPQGGYVPILYTSMYGGMDGASFGLLFYSWDENKFMMYWCIHDGGLVLDCVRAGGSANYFLWLNITDLYGQQIVLKQEKLDVTQNQGVAFYAAERANTDIFWPLNIEMVGFVGGTYFQESKWQKFLFIEKLVGLAFTLWDLAKLAELIYLYPVTHYYLGVMGPWGFAAVVAWIAAQYLIKSYFMAHAEHAALDWLKSEVGGDDSWSTVVFGVVNENVQKSSYAEVSLSGPLHVHDTLNNLEVGDPYELQAYYATVRAYRFNKVSFTFSTPTEVSDPIFPGVTHPGSKIWNFTYNGALSPGGSSPQYGDAHNIQYVWDLSLGPYYNWVSHSVSCFMHDQYGNPYWDFGYTVWIDPEHANAAGNLTIIQDYLASVELFGIEYFQTGSASFFNSVAQVKVEYLDARLTQLLSLSWSIQTPGFYLLNISSQDRVVFIPIFAYPQESNLSYVQVQIPDLPDIEEEVIVIVPKNSSTIGVNILKEENWNGTFGMIPIVIPGLDGFLGPLINQTVEIDLEVFGSSEKIIITYDNGDFGIEFSPFPSLHNYTVFTCNAPNPPSAYTPLITSTSDGLKFLVAYNFTEQYGVFAPTFTGTLLQFRLRQDVKWHDGRQLTAYDCAYAMNLVKEHNLDLYGSLWEDFVYAEAEEPYLLSVYFINTSNLENSKPFYRDYVALTATRFPKHIWSIAEEELVDLKDFDPASIEYEDWTGNATPAMYPLMTALVGNGPFVYRNYSKAYLPYEEYFIDKSGIASVVDADYRVDPGEEATFNVIIQNDYPTYNLSDELPSATLQVNVYEDDMLIDSPYVNMSSITYATLGPYITSLAAGPHTIKVELIDASNSTLLHTYIHTLKVTLMEDINYDFKVDIKDIASAARAFGSYRGDDNWNPDADINDDFKVDIYDIATIAKEFGWTS